SEMSNDNYCPACLNVLPYDEIDGQLYCSKCGRTKSVAETAAKAESYLKNNKKKWSRIQIVIGIIFFIVVFAVIMTVMESPNSAAVKNIYGTFVGTVFKVLLLLAFIWFVKLLGKGVSAKLPDKYRDGITASKKFDK
ncbi:MAG: hypothetical protein WCL71_09260, partial [Deltaproteobacteria bacterium]